MIASLLKKVIGRPDRPVPAPQSVSISGDVPSWVRRGPTELLEGPDAEAFRSDLPNRAPFRSESQPLKYVVRFPSKQGRIVVLKVRPRNEPTLHGGMAVAAADDEKGRKVLFTWI